MGDWVSMIGVGIRVLVVRLANGYGEFGAGIGHFLETLRIKLAKRPISREWGLGARRLELSA